MNLLNFIPQRKNVLMKIDNSQIDIDKVLEEKFMTSSKFSLEIENVVKRSNGSLNYIEAVVHFCAENNIEVDTVNKLISKPLKEKIRHDAQRLNYMKRSSNAKLII